MPTIAVDFDGVIHRYSRGWDDGSIYDPPIEGAIEGLRTLMLDFAVFVHTTRNPVPVAKWLWEQGLDARADTPDDPAPAEFWSTRGMLLVTNRKLPAVAYIDDRAIRFVSWAQTLSEVP